MNVLFICTSNKDRSPALEVYFRMVFPQHQYKSAGINKYFCEKKGTNYLTYEMLREANVVVFAEDIHASVVKRDFPDIVQDRVRRSILTLNLGDYEQGSIGEEYLTKAYLKLKLTLNKNEQ